MLISPGSQNLLKIFHLFAVSFWVGGSFCLGLLQFAMGGAASDEELYGMLRASRFINIYVVVYLGAFGSFFTGLAYSVCTNRGFFRHKWIIMKWMMTLGLIICGFGFLGAWSTAQLEMVQELGLRALEQNPFLDLRERLFYAQSTEMACFVLAFILSVYKPWEHAENMRHLRYL